AFWLICASKNPEAIHVEKIGCDRRFGNSLCRSIAVLRFRGETCARKQADRCLRPAERPLRLRLRSVQLVRGVYLPKRQVDTSAILALLSAQRAVPRAALLIANPKNNLLSDRSLRSSSSGSVQESARDDAGR